jgi:hypothetical protein
MGQHDSFPMVYNVDEESPRNPWGFLICRCLRVFSVKRDWQTGQGYGIIEASTTKAPRCGGEGKCPARCVGPPGQVAILQHGMAAWSRAAFWLLIFPYNGNCAKVGRHDITWLLDDYPTYPTSMERMTPWHDARNPVASSQWPLTALILISFTMT